MEWATEEDRAQANRDGRRYGIAFCERDENGLWRRVDPSTVKPASPADPCVLDDPS